MGITYFDLVQGFEFVAPGAGKFKYRVDKVVKQVAYCTRTKQNGDESETELSTDTILNTVNREENDLNKN